MLPPFVVFSKILTKRFRANFFIPFSTGYRDGGMLGVPSEDPELNVLISPGLELCLKHPNSKSHLSN